MRDNLKTYYSILKEVSQWLPTERITRLRNLALLMTGLLLATRPHLSVIANKLPLEGKLPSLSNRLRRFLDNPAVDVRTWYEPLAKQLLDIYRHQKLKLVIDCTKLGFSYQLMTVAVAYRKRSIPLAWSVHHGSRGATSSSEQIELLKYVQTLLPQTSEVILLGDGEFNTVPLLRWLKSQNWGYIVRQGANSCVKQQGKEWRKLGDYEIEPGQTRYLGWVTLTKTHAYTMVSVVIHWEKGEKDPWFLVTNVEAGRHTIRLYKVRMWIEEMYGDFKGHGFNLEDTHLRSVERLSRLVLAICLLYLWLISVGSWLVKRGFRHLIDRKERRDKSYFRLGFDWITRCLRLGTPFVFKFVPYL